MVVVVLFSITSPETSCFDEHPAIANNRNIIANNPENRAFLFFMTAPPLLNLTYGDQSVTLITIYLSIYFILI